MTTHYLYMDESGTLDFASSPGSTYFGIGTAYHFGEHKEALWEWHELKIQLEEAGIQVPKGLHAYNDSHEARIATFRTISQQNWRFDTTFLRKDAANLDIQNAGKPRLYKMAVWLHLKFVIPKISKPGDEIVLVVGQIKISSHRNALRHAVTDICDQLNFNRRIKLCIWDASSTWGIQVADYGLWRIQREIEGRNLPEYATAINHQLAPTFFPWGK